MSLNQRGVQISNGVAEHELDPASLSEQEIQLGAMSEEAYARAKEIFARAVELEDSERDAFLARACGADSELRGEIDSLLEHHFPRSLIGARSPGARPRAQPRLRPEPFYTTHTTDWWFGRLFSGLGRRRIWILVAIAFPVGLGPWVHARFEQALLEIRRDELEAVLSTGGHALENWIESQKTQIELMAMDPRVLALAEELIELADDHPVSVEALKRAPARAALLEILEPMLRQSHNTGGARIVDERGVHVFTTSEPDTGAVLSATGHAFVSDALAGATVFTRPYRGVDFFRYAATGTMYTFAITPLRASGGPVIGVLGTAQESYGPRSISSILEVARLGDTGETYAFDRDGFMLSESRFIDELRELGLSPSLDETKPAWDRGAQLNVQVRDPGGDLRKGHHPELELAARPLTRLAALAVAARGKNDPAELESVVLTPYRNYRGVEVIGAWKWLADLDFAVATEMEASETMAPLRYLEISFGVLFAILSIFVAAVSSFSVARLRRPVRKLKQLGPYRLIKSIGEGGMGIVYLAEHALLKRDTAVKILSRPYSKENAARFEREVRLASQLTHPNTIEIYDYGRSPEGVFYYAMEYVNGLTLSELVTRYGALPPGRTVHILKQVCASLGEAHRKGLVHRDIKPQNIMLCERGGEHDVVKVLDFGLVKNVLNAGGASITSEMRIGGTPLYMPPERLTAPSLVDERSDIYSLGAVASYLLTGRPLFEASAELELLYNVVNAEPQRPSEISPQLIPPDLEVLVMDCLSKRPEERPQSVFAVAERLQNLHGIVSWNEDDSTRWWQEFATKEAEGSRLTSITWARPHLAG